LFAVFPTAIIGAMMFLVGVELTKFAKNIRLSKDLLPMGATIIVSLLSNMALGFVAGLLVHYLIRFIMRRRGDSSSNQPYA
jgi:MFS superfamily sulfate permease-like transporter